MAAGRQPPPLCQPPGPLGMEVGQVKSRSSHQTRSNLKQEDILHFMQHIYAMDENDKRKLRFLYHHSGIEQRYSIIPDYSRPIGEWKFYPHTENLEPFPSLELRMAWYQKYAAALSVDAIRDCLGNKINPKEITHLITVSCTGMSAPGLDLQVMELMDLPKNIFRTSIHPRHETGRCTLPF